MIPTLLTAPYVVTMDAQRRILADGAVLVRGRQIEAIGHRRALAARAPDAERVALDGHVILPGFVDCHLHATQTLARGLADDIDEVKVRWGWDRIFPWEAALEDEDVYVSGLLTAVELVRNGVTCFADPGGFSMEPIARAVAESGIRAVLTVGGMDTWSAGFPLPVSMMHENPTQWALDASERLIADWHGKADGRIRGGYSIRVLMNASERFVVEVGRRARDRNLTVQIHLAVSPDRVKWITEKTGRRPVEYLEHLGILGPNWVLAHLGWVHESEIPILKRLDVKVCHCPGSSMHNARGAVRHGKFPEMAAAGVTLCLGADAAACNNSLDMFRTMYLTALAHDETRLRYRLFPPERVLEMATLGGARALLWDDAIGSLEPGKRADLIAVELARSSLSPVYDFSVVPNLVYAGSGADVTFVMVDGRVLMRDRRVTFVDEAALIRRAQMCGERVLARVPYRLQPRWPLIRETGGACQSAALTDRPLLYGPQCLWSAARYGVPVVFFIINNRGYVSIKQSLHKFARRARRSGDYVGCDLAEPTIDMVGLARSLGVEAYRVTSAKELAPALEKALASAAPVLLDVVVGEEEYLRAADGSRPGSSV